MQLKESQKDKRDSSNNKRVRARSCNNLDSDLADMGQPVKLKSRVGSRRLSIDHQGRMKIKERIFKIISEAELEIDLSDDEYQQE